MQAAVSIASIIVTRIMAARVGSINCPRIRLDRNPALVIISHTVQLITVSPFLNPAVCRFRASLDI